MCRIYWGKWKSQEWCLFCAETVEEQLQNWRNNCRGKKLRCIFVALLQHIILFNWSGAGYFICGKIQTRPTACGHDSLGLNFQTNPGQRFRPESFMEKNYTYPTVEVKLSLCLLNVSDCADSHCFWIWPYNFWEDIATGMLGLRVDKDGVYQLIPEYCSIQRAHLPWSHGQR